jgi:phosphoribulokinase
MLTNQSMQRAEGSKDRLFVLMSSLSNESIHLNWLLAQYKNSFIDNNNSMCDATQDRRVDQKSEQYHG